MNLKQLYIFGMENSQEPVIKNPILRAALEGPGPMAQEPRNMKLAKYIPRHERDNFNTPDLEQSPDSFLRPGETLEDWDTTFRRPNAHGGRIGFFRGESVVKSHGDKIIQLGEAGESSISIAKKLRLKQQTVNDAINSIEKGLAGDNYKFSKPFKDIIKSKEARIAGWKKRKAHALEPKNIEMVRENLIKNKKKVTMLNNQFIFADEKLEKEFLDDMLLRYKYPKTSTAATQAGVKSNKQIFETYFKGTYSEKGVHDLINRFKKTLKEDFSRLHPSERDAHKLRRQAKLLITQAGKRISGLDDFPSHHLFPIGDEFAHGTQDFTILDKKTNSQLSGSNKQLIGLAEQRSDLINDVQTGKINIKEFDIEMGKLDNQAQTIIDGHYKKFPKHDGLLNWRKAGSMVDDQGRFMDIVSTGSIGGDSSKWVITDVNKQIKDLSKTELATFRSDIKNKANDFLKQAGFDVDKCFSEGGRVSLKFGKGVNTCITGVIEAEQKKAMQGNKISKAKFGKFGKYARTAGWFLGAWDVPIELAFALPHMLQGDKEAAKRATTAGLLGWGEKKLDEVKADSPEAYKYAKHVKDNNDWVDAWFITQDKTEELETLKEGTGAQENALSQLNKANAKMEKIQEEYVGYVDEEGNFDPMAGAGGKTALQDYLREDVKKKADAGLTITDIPLLGDYNMAPYKGGDPITNVKQYIEQKNEPYWKSGLEHAAEEAGVADLYDTFMQGADNKDPRDLYSELPLEYASELAALEKEELEEGLLAKRLTEGFATGGIASLMKKW